MNRTMRICTEVRMSKKTPPATAATISFPAAPERVILRNQRRQRMVATARAPMAYGPSTSPNSSRRSSRSNQPRSRR